MNPTFISGVSMFTEKESTQKLNDFSKLIKISCSRLSNAIYSAQYPMQSLDIMRAAIILLPKIETLHLSR
jgi:hypothetical protein